MNSESKTKKFDEKPIARVLFLDVIRVFSLLLIICYHFDAGINDVHPGVPLVGKLVVFRQSIGDLGVALFIILSGAALTLHGDRAFNFVTFFKKRILAIYPSYWVCYLTISVFLFFLRGVAQGRSEYWKFILTFFAMDGYLGAIIQNDYYLIGEWFVGFIIVMYLLFPILRLVANRFPVSAAVGLLLLIGLIDHYYGHLFQFPEIRNPLIRLPDFFFGICFVKYIYPRKKIVLPASLIIFVAYVRWGEALPPPYASLIAATSLFCMVGLVAEYMPGREFFAPYIARASKLSFIAFLVHHWVIYLSLGRINAAQLSTIEIYYLFAIVVGLSFGIASLLEKPVSLLSNFMARRILFPRTAP
ncbi:acyltransferase [Paraburkholderia terrae]|uniref:acyltransferase family protein n=1 Tax=Paraburkholderia terrae TaxID=311230 RepID=UPI001EE1B2FA|nr:acyltransferase [Paraburkholderia terrae]GJH02912.1 acyltransferase family protein [Paraburkholderia terrae]